MENELIDKYYFNYNASLRIFGENLDFQKFSDILNLKPSHAHKKGEKYSGNKSHEIDMWIYESSLNKNESIDKHIDYLWNNLYDKVDILNSLKQNYRVDIFLGFRTNCETAGLKIPYQSLKLFNALQIPFEISIIVV